MLFYIEKARFSKKNCFWKTVLNIVFIRNRNQNFWKRRNGNRNKSSRFQNTGGSGSHNFGKLDPDPDHIRVKDWTRTGSALKSTFGSFPANIWAAGGGPWRLTMEAWRLKNGAGSGSGKKWKVISVINVKSWIQFRISKMMQKSTTLAVGDTNLLAQRAGLLTTMLFFCKSSLLTRHNFKKTNSFFTLDLNLAGKWINFFTGNREKDRIVCVILIFFFRHLFLNNH